MKAMLQRSAQLNASRWILTSALAVLVAFPGCTNYQASQPSLLLAEKLRDTLGCHDDFVSAFFDGLYEIALSRTSFSTPREMQSTFEATFATGRLGRLSAGDRARLAALAAEVYELAAIESLREIQHEESSTDRVMEILTSLEMGDRSTESLADLQDRLQATLAEMKRVISLIDHGSSLEQDCPAKPEDRSQALEQATQSDARSLLGHWMRTRHGIVYGGLKSLVVSNQSCSAASLAPLTRHTPDVEGISIVGTHPNGIGSRRQITNLQALLRTQPYLVDSPKAAPGCFQVSRSPLIYDYGGKPAVTRNSPSPSLDFFTDAGGGTSVLGLDCSGYVFAALATGGIRTTKGKPLKAAHVFGVNAAKYLNPQSSGLTCFDFATFTATSSLLPGDILASSGHVLIIESVGRDPFGIASFRRESDCRAQRIDPSKFDFTILQSAPIKGGIGINRIRGADYLEIAGGSMTLALMDHAVNACLAKIRGTSIKTRAQDASLVRHSGTDECRNTPIRLTHEECVSSCPAAP
jgi:hypothetical protein